MVEVTCKIDNQGSNNPVKIVISSVSHGVGRVEINIGAAHAEVDGKDLITAVQNCLTT